MTDAAAEEPKGAVYLRILARAMIRDYATFAGNKLASWKAGRDAEKAAKEAAQFANLGTDPQALDYLTRELTVQLADMTLRTTEAAKAMAADLGEHGRI